MKDKKKTREPVLEGCHMPQRVSLIAANATLRLFHPLSFPPARFRQEDALQMYDEIIPDSEPEREDWRQHLNEGRTVKRTRKRQGAESTRSVSLVLSSSPEPDLSATFDLSI